MISEPKWSAWTDHTNNRSTISAKNEKAVGPGLMQWGVKILWYFGCIWKSSATKFWNFILYKVQTMQASFLSNLVVKLLISVIGVRNSSHFGELTDQRSIIIIIWFLPSWWKSWLTKFIIEPNNHLLGTCNTFLIILVQKLRAGLKR